MNPQDLYLSEKQSNKRNVKEHMIGISSETKVNIKVQTTRQTLFQIKANQISFKEQNSATGTSKI